MNYNYTADMKYAKIVANKANLGLQIDSNNPQPRTDGKCIYLPPLDPTWDRSSFEYKQWWYSLLHECFHNLHPEDFTMLKDKEIDTRSFLGTLLNLALDYKIETLERGDFVGRDHLVHEARYAFARDKIYAEFGKTNPADDPDGLRARLEAVWVMDALCRIPWIPEYGRDDLPGLLGPESQGWYVKLLQDREVFDLYKNQKTSEDSFMVMCHLCAVLEIDMDDPKNNAAPKTAPGDAAGDAWVKFSEMTADQHDDPSDRDGGLHIDYDSLPAADWVPLPIEDIKLDAELTLGDRALLSEIEKGTHEVNLSKRIRRELQSMARTRFEGGKKRGRIRGKSLFKAVAQDNDKIMRQRVVKFNPKSTSAMVLQDWSGSMGGDKLKHATVATHELSRVLDALMIPHGVFGFSTHSREKNLLLTLKTFAEGFNSQKFLTRSVNASHQMHCNADGDYLLWAGHQLLKRKSARKILFVLSDGSPAARDKHGNRGIMQYTQKVAKDLEKMGIEVYAIGIEDRNVQKIYRNNVVINNARDLEASLLTVLRNKLLAGMV